MNSYEQVAYPGASYPQSHPERLAMVARLHGLQPADVTSCRVLELGCGSGENLLPLAMQFPAASFHGIDLSPSHVARAQHSIAALRLENLRIEQGDITDLPGRVPEVDYLIAHGVYSWVPAPVRDALLRTCRQCLASHGVAFVSYNVNPGWRSVGVVREALLFHLQGLDDPSERVNQARVLLEFMRVSIPDSAADYRKLYEGVIAALSSDASLSTYLFHDVLSEYNQPLYFTEFVAHAGEHGLRFLAEADICDMSPRLWGESVARALATMGEDVVKREQYLDFLRNRVFRQSLICRGDVRPSAAPDPDAMSTLCVACPPDRLREADASQPLAPLAILDAEHNPRDVETPLLRAALRTIAEQWPRAVPCKEVIRGARARLAAGRLVVETADDFEQEERILREGLLELLLLGAVEAFTRSPPVATGVSERPRASAWARFRIAEGKPFCNLRNEPIEFAEVTRELLLLLDGDRDHAMLRDGLLELIARKGLVVCEDGVALRDREQLQPVIERRLQQQLSTLARGAMLEA